MYTYLAFLRGINVGGKSLIKMDDLRASLESRGFSEVRTYIQSGNVIFRSSSGDTDQLAKDIRGVIEQTFQLSIAVAVFSEADWRRVIDSAPQWWGRDQAWKHNILIMLEDVTMSDVVSEIGELKPDIEALLPGDRVLYQSISWKDFGKARSGRIASLPVYKQMTIRNYSTATKLLGLLVH